MPTILPTPADIAHKPYIAKNWTQWAILLLRTLMV